ncbi:MAG TPA: hypothetical protein DGU45_04310 [Planctomycetes bacterium]|nr:hypothetical protein [Planctomycetota bacterium]
MQEEVLQRTRRLDARRKEGEELNPLEKRLLERLVQRQGSILELTEQIAKDLQEQMAPPEVQESAPEELESGEIPVEPAPGEDG